MQSAREELSQSFPLCGNGNKAQIGPGKTRWQPTPNRLGVEFRHMLVFVFFDKHADDFHERRKRMVLVLTHLIDETVEERD